ncbi:MAG: hypothetical protein LBI17_00665, partial [Rickettsiales bacterium]|nr:hypothetical protein [Rickettsiales bacterium]
MRIQKILAAISISLSLAACGGGGGGGGGPSDNGRLRVVSETNVTSATLDAIESNVVKNVTAGSAVYPQDTNNNSITKNADNKSLDLSFNNGFSAVSMDITNPGTFKKVTLSDGTYFYVGRAEGTKNNISFNSGALNTSGASTLKHELVLGGKSVGLQYSDFGVWRMDVVHNGDVTNGVGALVYDGLNLMQTPAMIAIGNSKTAGYALSGAPQTFTGAAVAVASNGEYDIAAAKNATVYGTARLTITPTAGTGLSSGNTLELNFANFYKFTFSNLQTKGVNLGASSGEISTPLSNSLTITDTGNNTGIDFDLGSFYTQSAANC